MSKLETTERELQGSKRQLAELQDKVEHAQTRRDYYATEYTYSEELRKSEKEEQAAEISVLVTAKNQVFERLKAYEQVVEDQRMLSNKTNEDISLLRR